MSKTIKIILYILFGIIMLGGMMIATAEIMLRHRVESLVSTITNTPPAPYRINTGKVSFNIFAGTFSVRDIRMETIENSSFSTYTLIKVDCISGSGINIRSHTDGLRLKIGSITVESPVVDVTTYRGELNRQKEEPKGKKGLQGLFSAIEMNNFNLENGSVTYGIRDENSRLTTGNINVKMADMVIDSKRAGDDAFSGRLEIGIDSIRYYYDNEQVRMGFDSIKFDSSSGLLSAAAFEILPLVYPKYEYASKSVSHSDWTKWSIENISCHGINIPALLTDKTLDIDSISLTNGTALSYKDRNVAQIPIVKKLFFITMRELPVKISTRSIALHNFDITYEELREGGEKSGIITLNGLNAEFKGLTNIYTEGGAEYFTLEANYLIQNEGRTVSMCKFPINPDNDHFEVWGTIGAMNMVILNSVFMPLNNIEIKSGKVKSVEYLIAGNDVSSKNTITLIYDAFEIELLKKSPDGGMETRKFLTEIFKTVILYPSNPRSNGELRIGEGTFERDIYKSQYNYLWKSLFSAIKNTII